jgi:hypothetical protein
LRDAETIKIIRSAQKSKHGMKRITKEEAAALPKRPNNRLSWFRGVLFGMSIGEIILLEPQDWKQKRAPSTVIKRMTAKQDREWKCETVLQNRGWVIERTN